MTGIYDEDQRREQVRDVHIPDETADAAWATIQRHCPDDADTIGRMLGVTT